MSAHGGVVFRVGSGLHFLPATIATKLLPVPELARVPGAPRELRGIALVDGDMIPVVDAAAMIGGGAGAASGAMLVCTVLGETLALVGLEVVATGRFEVEGDAVRHHGEGAKTFDIAAAIARVREGRWAV